MPQYERSWFKLDSHSKAPLYYQIKANLHELIDSGRLAPGDLLPAESELGEYYGVNRLTVRQAVGELVSEGLLRRERGRGTFVCPPKTTHAMLRSAGFSERMRDEGRQPSNQVISFEVVPASAKVAEQLQIEPGALVYQLTRLRLADDEPQMLETAYLPHGRFAGMETLDFGKASLYSTLDRRFGCRVIAADMVFEPILLTGYEAELLRTKPNTPAQLLELVAYDQNGDRVEYNKSIMRGDKARLLFHVRRQIWNEQETMIEWLS
ncbi:MAG: GntR family transcriptional regulator [Anaerolineae bacterium]